MAGGDQVSKRRQTVPCTAVPATSLGGVIFKFFIFLDFSVEKCQCRDESPKNNVDHLSLVADTQQETSWTHCVPYPCPSLSPSPFACPCPCLHASPTHVYPCFRASP